MAAVAASRATARREDTAGGKARSRAMATATTSAGLPSRRTVSQSPTTMCGRSSTCSITCAGAAGRQQYLLDWLAHLIKKPGTKMHTAPVVSSEVEGIGKNLVFECVASIIGERHAVVVGQDTFDSAFNGWAARKVFVIGDEISSSDRRRDSHRCSRRRARARGKYPHPRRRSAAVFLRRRHSCPALSDLPGGTQIEHAVLTAARAAETPTIAQMQESGKRARPPCRGKGARVIRR